MKKIVSMLVIMAVFAAVFALAAPAAAEEVVPPENTIYGYKWYDTDMDGEADMDGTEGLLTGWPIQLWKDGVVVATDLTDEYGRFEFSGLAAGEYQVKEVMDSCWVQTYPALLKGYEYYTFQVTEGGSYFAPFKNVCVRKYSGFTPGYWGNKNGLAALQWFVKPVAQGGAGGTLPQGMTAVQWNNYFRAGSTAVNMCDKLMWTYWAYWMNTHVKGLSYAGASVWIDGELIAYDDVIGDYAGCTGDRGTDEFYKDLFDGLNNINGYGFSVVPYAEACAVPTVWQ